MGVVVHKNYFDGLREALEDIARDGYWPTTFVSEPSPPPAVHWHDCDVHGYVMDGTTWILDGETGQHLTVEPGDKLVIPAGALHIEGEAKSTVVYIVAVPQPRSFVEVFQLRSPDDPARPNG
jgi:uncharacterized protein YjlB